MAILSVRHEYRLVLSVAGMCLRDALNNCFSLKPLTDNSNPIHTCLLSTSYSVKSQHQFPGKATRGKVGSISTGTSTFNLWRFGFNSCHHIIYRNSSAALLSHSQNVSAYVVHRGLKLQQQNGVMSVINCVVEVLLKKLLLHMLGSYLYFHLFSS